jgi:hypothetical protein
MASAGRREPLRTTRLEVTPMGESPLLKARVGSGWTDTLHANRAAQIGGITTGGLILVTSAYVFLLRPKQLKWGATDDEVVEPLPGDDLVSSADLTATRGVTIHRRAADVWPWIAQLGQGRGGLYSYDVLENLVGCDMHSANRIVPEWQVVRVGDQVRLHPAVALAVAVVDPGYALVVRGGVPMGQTPPPYDFTWAFVLKERTDGATRLLVRERYRYTRWWAPLLLEPVELISFVMSQKMLRGIKKRAEAVSQPEVITAASDQ